MFNFRINLIHYKIHKFSTLVRRNETMNEDLLHPRINILYILERKNDAEILYSKFDKLGAKVNLIEVSKGSLTGKQEGKIYYFDESPRFEKIGLSLVKSLQSIEPISLEYVKYIDLPKNKQPNYAIWIVRENKILSPQILIEEHIPVQETVKNFTNTQNPIKRLLIKCDKCDSSVLPERMEKHVNKVHSKISSKLGRSNPTNKIKKSKSIRRIDSRLYNYNKRYYSDENKESYPSIISSLLEKIELGKKQRAADELNNQRSKRTTNSTFQNSKRNEFLNNNTKIKKLGRKKCQHCGYPAMLGETTCYACHSK